MIFFYLSTSYAIIASRGEACGERISLIDLAGIGNLLEHLVVVDNISCEERDQIMLRIENDIAEYTLPALAGYGRSKSEV